MLGGVRARSGARFESLDKLIVKARRGFRLNDPCGRTHKSGLAFRYGEASAVAESHDRLNGRRSRFAEEAQCF